MATCTPQALPAEATCFHCIPPDAKRVAEIYLLNTLAGNLTARQLSAGAAPFRPFDNKLALAAKVYLMTVINGVMPTPAQLMADAACWQCIPGSARLDVEAYLVATSAGSIDPQAITRRIGPYKSLYPIRDQVELYQLSILAGSPSIASIMAGAKCLTCLSSPRLEEIFLKQLCGGLSTNLIPVGSVYGGGGTPEFDLPVLANTTYLIIWGSHELYVNICGNVYYSTGAGTELVVATASCTLMQFFGTFAGTTVTAIVKPVLPGAVIPVPTGFTWTIVGANAVATWDASPAGVFSVELWTSTDGLGYSLASTTVVPGTTSSVTAPASGTVLYGKIRATSKVFPGLSAFTSPLVVSQDVSGWAARVVANGGAAPSANSIAAAANFVAALVSAGIFNKFRTLNMVAPDNLIAARTPLIVGTGLDPWPNVGASNFAAADLTIYGLQCDGTKALDTGVLGTSLSLSNAGITIIASVINPNNGFLFDMGYLNAGANQYMFVAAAQTGVGNTGHAGGSSFSTGQILDTGAAKTYAGYISYNRTSAIRADLYWANNDVPHSSIGNNTNNQASGIAAVSLYFGAVRDSGGGAIPYYSRNTLSLGAVHDGLTASESLAFFNAANTLRTAFGGGWGDIGDSYVGSWVQRVLGAGGATPGATSIAAVHTLATSLWSAGIITKFFAAIPLVPDSLIAAITPIFRIYGNASWANNNFVAGDLNINGLIGGNTKYLDPGSGLVCNVVFSAGSAGLISYVFTDSATGFQNELAVYSAAPASFFGLACHQSTTGNAFGCWRTDGNDILSWTNPVPTTGFFSGQRTATNAIAAYFANSTNPHALLASNAGATAGAPLDRHPYAFAGNSVGTPNFYSLKRVSFLAITSGLSSSEDAAAYAAIQAFRTAIGGGFV